MYSEVFNSAMQNGTVPILKHQPYLDANGKTTIYNGRNATMADVDYSVVSNTYKFSKREFAKYPVGLCNCISTNSIGQRNADQLPETLF